MWMVEGDIPSTELSSERLCVVHGYSFADAWRNCIDARLWTRDYAEEDYAIKGECVYRILMCLS